MRRVPLDCEVNGRPVSTEVDPRRMLSDVLREDLSLTSVHVGCGHGVCGACTVLVDGETRRSCLTLAAAATGRSIVTLEGLSDGGDRLIGVLQRAFMAHGGLQCGFCTPGMLIAARDLLAREPTPDRTAAREALAGNICRCTGYGPIVDAVTAAAADLAG
jgi:carbon-monoxide dehydrogenase small subunit